MLSMFLRVFALLVCFSYSYVMQADRLEAFARGENVDAGTSSAPPARVETHFARQMAATLRSAERVAVTSHRRSVELGDLQRRLALAEKQLVKERSATEQYRDWVFNVHAWHAFLGLPQLRLPPQVESSFVFGAFFMHLHSVVIYTWTSRLRF